MHIQRVVLPPLCAALLAACSGSGAGLDENGRPVTDVNASLTAEFASIQARVFTPYCTACHQGAAAPLGLRLTEDVSYSLLVNAPSVEQPALKRVLPGDPDGSYLVRKISGTAAVGGRMPLGGPPLPQEAIDAIRQWIRDGAAGPRVAPAALPALAPSATQLVSVFPMHAAWVDFELDGQAEPMTGAVVIGASGELDTSTIAAAAMRLERAGGDDRFDDGNEITLAPLHVELRSLEPTVFAVTPPVPWVPDRYRLTVPGSGPLPVRDRAAREIDGDGDQLPGGDLVVEFEVGSLESLR